MLKFLRNRTYAIIVPKEFNTDWQDALATVKRYTIDRRKVGDSVVVSVKMSEANFGNLLVQLDDKGLNLVCFSKTKALYEVGKI